MSDSQYKSSYRQGFAWWDAAGLDIPQGTCTQIHHAFKEWEKRRGFTDPDSEDRPDPMPILKGSALRAKLALESKKRVLAQEAEKARKKAAKKGLKKSEKPTNFAPDIVGKVYMTQHSASRKIKNYILANHLIIPADYEFGINKLAWDKYEITGCRKQTKEFKPKVKPTEFAPDIVGKQFATNSNARRLITKFIKENKDIIPADYEFGINKIDWGCYEITGTRKTKY